MAHLAITSRDKDVLGLPTQTKVIWDGVGFWLFFAEQSRIKVCSSQADPIAFSKPLALPSIRIGKGRDFDVAALHGLNYLMIYLFYRNPSGRGIVRAYRIDNGQLTPLGPSGYGEPIASVSHAISILQLADTPTVVGAAVRLRRSDIHINRSRGRYFVNEWEECLSLPTTTLPRDVQLVSIPKSNDMYLIYSGRPADGSRSQKSTALYGRYYTWKNTWSLKDWGREEFLGELEGTVSLGAIATDNLIHLSCLDSTGALRHRCRSQGTNGKWAKDSHLIEQDRVKGHTLVANEKTGSVWAIYGKGRQLLRQSFENGWQDRDVLEENSDLGTGKHQVLSSNGVDVDKVGIAWQTKDGSLQFLQLDWPKRQHHPKSIAIDGWRNNSLHPYSRQCVQVRSGRDTRVYFSYLARGGVIRFLTMDRKSGQWGDSVDIDRLDIGDAHCYPYLFADNSDYLYLLYGGRYGMPLRLKRSRFPSSWAEWNQNDWIDEPAFPHVNAVYYQADVDSNDNVHIVYCDALRQNLVKILLRENDVWHRPVELVNFDRNKFGCFLWRMRLEERPDKTYCHLVWNVYDKISEATWGVYYVKISKSENDTFRAFKHDDSEIKLPVHEISRDSISSERAVSLGDLVLSDNGAPYICWLSNDKRGRANIFLSWPTEDGWRTAPIAGREKSSIPLGRPQVTRASKGRFLVVYAERTDLGTELARIDFDTVKAEASFVGLLTKDSPFNNTVPQISEDVEKERFDLFWQYKSSSFSDEICYDNFTISRHIRT